MDLWGWLRDKFAEVSAFVRENVESFIQAIQGLFNSLTSFARNIQGQLSRFNPFGGGTTSTPSSANSNSAEIISGSGGSADGMVVGSEGGDSLSNEAGIGSLASAMLTSSEGEEIPATMAVSTPGAQAAGITNSVANNTQNTTSGGINVSAINITNTSGDPAEIVNETLRQLDAAFDEEMAARMA